MLVLRGTKLSPKAAQEARAVAEAGDHLEPLTVWQARVEQAHTHQREAHGQAGGQRRPPQRRYVALQLLVALGADDFMQHRRAGWLVLVDVLPGQ